ncbi:MAG: hypothetical protein KKB70_02530, partial [Proteobacteria bacterium]|nr:hypothetical protein [Pseudomonadota bacterium]
AEEVMSVCWPDYYADEKAQLQDRGMIDSLFSKDALDTLKEEQSVFRSRIKAGLVKVYQDSDKGSIKGESDIMSSLASDEARINQSGIVTRVVVYSDLGDQETPTKGKYSIDFGHAIFYVFGVSGSVSSHSAWEAAFKESNGLLAAFGSDLGISGDAPVEYARYGVEFETTKSKFFGDMVLFVTADGNLQDSYLSINDAIIGRVSLLTGILKSGSSGKMLQAKTVSGLATDEKGESLQVSGPDRLKGTIGHPGAIVTDTTQEALFEIVATPVQ